MGGGAEGAGGVGDAAVSQATKHGGDRPDSFDRFMATAIIAKKDWPLETVRALVTSHEYDERKRRDRAVPDSKPPYPYGLYVPVIIDGASGCGKTLFAVTLFASGLPISYVVLHGGQHIYDDLMPDKEVVPKLEEAYTEYIKGETNVDAMLSLKRLSGKAPTNVDLERAAKKVTAAEAAAAEVSPADVAAAEAADKPRRVRGQRKRAR